MFWIERTAMAFSGIYYVYGSHASCWYLAICLFSLCNAVHIINLVAPEKAGRVVHEIISLCSPTCSSRVSALDPISLCLLFVCARRGLVSM